MKTISKLEIKREGGGEEGKDIGKEGGKECPIVPRPFVIYFYVLITVIQYTLQI